jgi:hypothetical protein
MKLRVKGNSLRLRLSRSEVARLVEEGRIEETIYFGEGDDAKFTYALEHAAGVGAMTMRYRAQQATVLISTDAARRWAEGDDVGMYGEVGAGGRRLEMMVEKDFACLDRSDAENADTFPHPKLGAVC